MRHAKRIEMYTACAAVLALLAAPVYSQTSDAPPEGGAQSPARESSALEPSGSAPGPPPAVGPEVAPQGAPDGGPPGETPAPGSRIAVPALRDSTLQKLSELEALIAIEKKRLELAETRAKIAEIERSGSPPEPEGPPPGPRDAVQSPPGVAAPAQPAEPAPEPEEPPGLSREEVESMLDAALADAQGPGGDATAGAPPAGGGGARDAPGLPRVRGVEVFGSRARALLRYEDGAELWVRPGDTLPGGGEVREVGRGGVIIASRGRDVRLRPAAGESASGGMPPLSPAPGLGVAGP